MSGWDIREAQAKGVSVKELQRQRAIDDNQLAEGYKEAVFKDAYGKDVRYAVRIDPRGEAEGYQLKDTFQVRQRANGREWLVAETTQMERFQVAEMEQIQISEIEDVATGVIGSAVVIGGIRPHAYHPGGWNVLTHRTATLNSEFSSLILPKPQLLSDMLISAAARADISGSDQTMAGLVTDTPGGGSDGQTVIFDEGFTVDPDYVAGARLTHPVASVLADQQQGKPAWSVEVTAVCDHEGLAALEEHLLNIRMLPSNGIVYDGLRWAGMLQHNAGMGTVEVRSQSTTTFVGIQGLPDPVKYVLGNDDFPAPEETESTQNPDFPQAPEVAIVDLLVIWEIATGTDPIQNGGYKIRIFASRRQ